MVKIAITSAQGISHELLDIPCQDAVEKHVKENCFAVVLCDGAGSIENSEVASNFVCKFLSKYLCENLNELQTLQEGEISRRIYEALKEESKKESIKLDCTLLAVVGDGESEDIIFHIGDGIVIGENECDELEILSKPENGEETYITYFLSGENAKEHLRVTKTNCTSYILTSDGISNLLYNGVEIKTAASIMLDWLKQSDELITEKKLFSEINRIFKQYTQDDISVAIINKGRN